MDEVVNLLIEKKKTISTMESCTGGGIANSITNIPGASNVFNFGAVTYSNLYKIKLGVNSEEIEEYTVYSEQVARDMSRAIVEFTNSNYGIGVTGKMNKPDPNNPYGDDNKVYVCIFDKDNDAYISKTITVTSEDRVSNKEQVMNEIKEILLSLLKGEISAK